MFYCIDSLNGMSLFRSKNLLIQRKYETRTGGEDQSHTHAEEG